MSRYFVLYHLRTAAFVAVAVAAMSGLWYVQQASDRKLREALIASCERGNLLRLNVNNETRIIRYFMLAAAKARQQAGRPADVVAAARYRAFADSLVLVEIPDCDRAVKQP